jgi:UDP:flavonoid glycosyltransferase YjiC (YdhE family)
VNLLLVPIGSHGDVHPFVGLGLALRARGHRVRVLINPYFAPLVEQAGLEQIPIGTAAEYQQLAATPGLWEPLKGPKIIFQAVGDLVAPVYETVVRHHVPGDTVVVASTLALGARVAQELHKIPTVSIHLQPSMFRSYTDPPTIPGMLTGPRVPHWLMKFQWLLIDKLVIDPLAAKGLNAFRKQKGLPPVKRILRDYLHSPELTIGLFPAWFAPPQADWPPQVKVTGFPLYDERGVSHLSADLLKFLEEGPPPIAFTFGSAMWEAQDLLEQSAHACALLGRRGILLTRHRDHLPVQLPPGVKHVDYAPFSELLPRCAALVHHGGIGTASQGLAAGVPQLVLPHAHDQLDNATRLARLGVAKFLAPKRYKAGRAARVLGELLESGEIAGNCREVAGRFAGVDVMGETCRLIEGLHLHGAKDVRSPVLT